MAPRVSSAARKRDHTENRRFLSVFLSPHGQIYSKIRVMLLAAFFLLFCCFYRDHVEKSVQVDAHRSMPYRQSHCRIRVQLPKQRDHTLEAHAASITEAFVRVPYRARREVVQQSRGRIPFAKLHVRGNNDRSGAFTDVL
ncbi:hypothetical protein MRX96_004734 [Rhipicephalus microplus]